MLVTRSACDASSSVVMRCALAVPLLLLLPSYGAVLRRSLCDRLAVAGATRAFKWGYWLTQQTETTACVKCYI